MDLLHEALTGMLPAREFQFVLLGSGDPRLERAFLTLAEQHSGQVAVRIGYDQGLSHRIEAGADFFAMPSRFEPCGLNQMYSLRYGTVPIVRATGGLDDTVVDISEQPNHATGIKFLEPAVTSLRFAMQKALRLYSTPHLLAAYQQNGMRADFSWAATVTEYCKAYRQL
jgi:starch synthase